MEVTRVADLEEAATRTAEVMATALASARTVHGVAHAALCGGETPRRAYELLGPMLDDWEGIHLWFGDERCVPPEDPEANSRMVAESLAAPGAVVHRMRGELGAEEAAAAYAAEFGDTVLDVNLVGIGEDGHTASMFPGNPALHATGVAVAVHGSPKPPPDRVSLTLPTLNAARRIVLLVSGEAKAPALRRALEGPDPDVPASLLNRDVLEVIADAAALPEQ